MSITLGWPVRHRTNTSSGFGTRVTNGSRNHAGIDIGTSGATGIKAYSVANGVVETVVTTLSSDRGRYVKIDHGTVDGQKFETLYQHLASVDVKVGDTVSLGQPVGTIGGSGKTESAFPIHLHFETYRGGAYIDPRYYYPYTNPTKNGGAFGRPPTSVSPITKQVYTADRNNEYGYTWILNGSATSTFELSGEGYSGSGYISQEEDSHMTDTAAYAAEYMMAQYFGEGWEDTDGTIGKWIDPERRFRNFYRSYRFEFGDSGGMGYAVGNLEGQTGRPLHISFSISRSDLASLNTARVNIWNLKQEHLNKLEDIGVTVCALYAGYGDRLALIFQGTVTFCTSVKEGADWKTTIELVDGFSSVKKTTVALSYDKNTTWKTILDDVAKQCGTTYIVSENTDLSGTVDDFSYIGQAGDILTKICESNAKLTWSIQHGIIHIKNRGEAMETSVAWHLTPETGLINSPSMVRASQFDTSNTTGLVYGFGFDITYLMNPFIAVGSKIRLESQRFEGVFSVASISISGDNEGGSWQCTSRIYPLQEGGYSDLELSKMIESGLTVTKSGFSIGGTNNNVSYGASGAGSYWNGASAQTCDNPQMTNSGLPYFPKALYTTNNTLFNDQVLECAAVSAFTEIGSAETSITLFAAVFWSQCNIIDYNGHTNKVKNWSYNDFRTHIANNHHCAYAGKWASRARGGNGTYWKDGCLWNTARNVNLTELARDVYSRWSAEKSGQSNVGRVLAYKNPRLPNGVNEIRGQETGTFIFYKSCNSDNNSVPERKKNRSYFMSSDTHGTANCWSQYWYFDYGSPYEKEEFYKNMAYYWQHPDFIKGELDYESANHTNRYASYPNTPWKKKRTW